MSGERVAASGSSPGHEPKCAECGHGKELHPFSDSGRRCTHPTCFCPWYRQPADPVVSPADTPEWNAWVEDAVNHDAGMWENEEIRWRKALYVGTHSERDRRSIHAESARAIKETLRFWKGIPAEYRERLALEAGLPSTAIPEELRVAADPVVSPADTPERIEQLREKAERHGRVVSDGDETYSESPGWNDVLFLLAVGERDRQRIAQLTAALIRLVNYLGTVGATEDDAIHTLVQQAAAVLSDKEDAGA